MKWLLISLCLIVIVGMSVITIAATLNRGMLDAGGELWPQLWFRATLMDAYFGFLTFFVWVAYKEASVIARVAWLIAIMLLGNFAMSGYLLWKLVRMEAFSWEELLLRDTRSESPASPV